MSGFAGKIVRINLTTSKISYIDTKDYEEWGGGHGIGSALFYDIAIREKGLDLAAMDHDSPTDGGFHPDNVLIITTSPLSACGVPAATGRTELQGIGVQSYPIGWFTRSGLGGRFGPMLKFAGYDAVVIEGQARRPVWVDIRDESIDIRPCNELGLWGKDTIDTQKSIWDFVTEGARPNSWNRPLYTKARTTQRPAVLAIGPAGENKSRMACLIHDAGNACGQGGFGGIWGAKNLKAISVIGTGMIPVSDPAGLVALRVFQKNNYQFELDTAKAFDPVKTPLRHNAPPTPAEMYPTPSANQLSPLHYGTNRDDEKRPQSCMGCHAGCRARYENAKANEAKCATTVFYPGNTKAIQVEATDLLNRYGFNAFDMLRGVRYLKYLYDTGVLGREIQTGLDFSKFGSLEFVKAFLDDVAYRKTAFGDTVAEGFIRAVIRWNRIADLGPALELTYWGLPDHGYDVRAELEWGYGTILGDRDINEHCFNAIHHHVVSADTEPTQVELVSPQEIVSIFTEKMVPHANAYRNATQRMQMLNYASDNMYSVHIARTVSWHRHFTRYYKQSMLFCDWRWPDIINTKQPNKKGSTGVAEPKFIEAITGKQITFEEGMKIGRRIWNLDNAIWTLQGRHRDMVQFADFIYTQEGDDTFKWPTYDRNAPAGERWAYRDLRGRTIDREGFENFKTQYYGVEGWNPDTGWPTQATLSELGLDDVADTLQAYGKL